jgi:membrane associated rhomboid family serine protease
MQQVRYVWPPLTLGVKALLILYAACFVPVLLGGTLGIDGFLVRYLMLSNEGLLGHLYLWQPLTHQWLHDGFLHLLFNGLVLYSFGGPVEQRLGWPKLVALVHACGLGGALATILTRLVFPVAIGPEGFSVVQTVGASGGIYGVVMAFSLYHWDAPMRLLLIPGAVQGKWLIPAFLAIDVLMTLLGGAPLALASHVGGALTALLLLGSTGGLRPLLDDLKLWRARRRLRALRGGGHPLEQDPKRPPGGWMN